MLRAALDTLTRTLGRLRSGRGRRLDPGPAPVRLNLGSSLLVAPGWVNLDGGLPALIAPLPRPLLRLAYRLSGMGAHMDEHEFVDVLAGNRFVHADLTRGIPFPDGCAEAIFSSHFFEHLSRREGEDLARECLRVLAPGGRIRISVPDLAWLVSEYERGNKRYAVDGMFEDEGRGELARHRSMYDADLLGELLASAGFGDVRRCSYREGDVPDLDVLDNREGSLVMEAVKTG